MKSSIEDLASVAKYLGPLNNEAVFVGGSVVFVLVPSHVVPSIRITEDVACVFQAATTADYYRLSERLKNLGFSECTDEGTPICRWVIDDIRVDVMPTGEKALGFCNRWYDWVLIDPLRIEVAPGIEINVVNIPTFFATKFEAFANRGHGLYAGDTDFEDIVTICAHSQENVAQLVLTAPDPIRSYLIDRAQELVALPLLDDYVSGCFASDVKSQSAVPRVLKIFQSIAAENTGS